jgi:hypothetical protein
MSMSVVSTISLKTTSLNSHASSCAGVNHIQTYLNPALLVLIYTTLALQCSKVLWKDTHVFLFSAFFQCMLEGPLCSHPVSSNMT